MTSLLGSGSSAYSEGPLVIVVRYPLALGTGSSMTVTPQEPLEEPEVVPSGDPAPIPTPDPEPQTEPQPEPE